MKLHFTIPFIALFLSFNNSANANITRKETNFAEATITNQLPSHLFKNTTEKLSLTISSIKEVSCHGATDGQFTVQGHGGTGNYQYSIDDGQTCTDSPTFLNLCARQYNVSIKDDSDTDNLLPTIQIFILEPAPINIDAGISDVKCAGDNTGAISLNVSGGTEHYSYQWTSDEEALLQPDQDYQTNLASGTYSVSVTDENNCTASRSFTIHEPDSLKYRIITSTPTCQGDDGYIEIINIKGGIEPYKTLWTGPGGINYTSFSNNNLKAGTYNILVRDAMGCGNFQTVTLTEPPVAMVSGSTTTCDNTVVLSGTDPEYGIGMWSVISGQGHFSDQLNPETKVTNLSSGENTFRCTITNDDCISSAEITVENFKKDLPANINQKICDNLTFLNAPYPNEGEGHWSVVPGMGSATFINGSDPKTPVTNLAHGTNLLIWNVDYGHCTSSDTITITNNMPYPAYAGHDMIIRYEGIYMSAQNPPIGIGKWSILSGGADINSLNDPNTRIDNLLPGDNIFRWTVTNEDCISTDDVCITKIDENAAYAGIDQTICSDETYLEAYTPGYNDGKWILLEGSGKFESMNDPHTRVCDLGRGRNVFRWTVDNFNDTSSDDVVIINNMPSEAYAGQDHFICDDSFLLDGNFPTTGNPTWSLISGGGIITDPHDPYTTINYLSKGENIITYKISKETCESVDTVKITNMTPTISNAGLDMALCNNTTTLQANQPAVGTGTWKIITGSGSFTNSHDPKTKVTGLSSGRNVLRWTINSQLCVSSDTVEIINNAMEALAGSDQISCSDSAYLMANEPKYGTGTWSVADENSTAIFTDQHNPNSLVYNLKQGINKFRWTINNKWCMSSNETTVTNNRPDKANAGHNQQLLSTTTTLDATPVQIGTGHWELLNGYGKIADTTNPKTQVTNLSPGKNTFRWIVENNSCYDYNDVTIINDLSTGIETTSQNKPCELNLFPVPVKEKLTIKLTRNCHPETVWIHSATGALIMQQSFSGSNETELQVGDLKPGLYLVKVLNADKEWFFGRFMKK